MSPYEKRLSLTSSTAQSSASDLGKKRSRPFSKAVQADVANVIDDSPFLRTKPVWAIVKHLARFEYSEIILGRQLGEGSFSTVYEIAGFELKDEISASLSKRNQRVREHYQENAVSPRTGKGRFVIKLLKSELKQKPDSYRGAATDMAVEAAYLMRLDHENILPLRGLPINGTQALDTEEGFFLILDRLEDTLDERIAEWQETSEDCLQTDPDVLKTKFEYSQQLAGALAYLHERRLVFRDLKPQNVGIDQSGRLRLFDFGLCRELPPQSTAFDDVYFMSGGVGTRRYMAPEVALNREYNCKVDVYGWSIVVWQMFSLAKPYSAYRKRDHTLHVCLENERPSLDASCSESMHEQPYKSIPRSMQSILKKAWTSSVSDRPSMEKVLLKLSRASQSKRNKGADLKRLARRGLGRNSLSGENAVHENNVISIPASA